MSIWYWNSRTKYGKVLIFYFESPLDARRPKQSYREDFSIANMGVFGFGVLKLSQIILIFNSGSPPDANHVIAVTLIRTPGVNWSIKYLARFVTKLRRYLTILRQ